jgi:hypothetical protein
MYRYALAVISNSVRRQGVALVPTAHDAPHHLVARG